MASKPFVELDHQEILDEVLDRDRKLIPTKRFAEQKDYWLSCLPMKTRTIPIDLNYAFLSADRIVITDQQKIPAEVGKMMTKVQSFMKDMTSVLGDKMNDSDQVARYLFDSKMFAATMDNRIEYKQEEMSITLKKKFIESIATAITSIVVDDVPRAIIALLENMLELDKKKSAENKENKIMLTFIFEHIAGSSLAHIVVDDVSLSYKSVTESNMCYKRTHNEEIISVRVRKFTVNPDDLIK